MAVVKLVVDGRLVEVAAGATLLDAVRAAGLALPTLCHDDRLTTVASCRTCLVDITGRGPAAACSTPAEDGLRVAVEASRALRRDALQAIVAGLPTRALDVPADRSELARQCADYGVTAPSGSVTPPERGLDHSHPYVKLDRDLCIACGRCVRACAEIQGTFALTLMGRGAGTVVAPGTGGPWAESDCVSCGACVDTCPTGALSEPGLLNLLPIERQTRTTCGYCGVGCSLEVSTRDNVIMTVRPAGEGSVNRGHACVKGRFAHGFLGSADRLTTPLIRRNGTLTPASWEAATGYVAARLAGIRDADPGGFAVISSARATNEENYLAQKFARAVMGTNNVDNCARLCHAPSAAGLAATFGLGGGTNAFDDLDRCDMILLVGANPTAAHPVVGSRIFQRVMDGARLVVVDPRRTSLARHADVHLRPRPGTNVAVFNGLAHLLVREGLVDTAFLDAHTSGYDELLGLLERLPAGTRSRNLRRPGARPRARRRDVRSGAGPGNLLRTRGDRTPARHGRCPDPVQSGTPARRRRAGCRRRGEPAARAKQRPGCVGHGGSARPAARLPEGHGPGSADPLRRGMAGRCAAAARASDPADVRGRPGRGVEGAVGDRGGRARHRS